MESETSLITREEKKRILETLNIQERLDNAKEMKSVLERKYDAEIKQLKKEFFNKNLSSTEEREECARTDDEIKFLQEKLKKLDEEMIKLETESNLLKRKFGEEVDSHFNMTLSEVLLVTDSATKSDDSYKEIPTVLVRKRTHPYNEKEENSCTIKQLQKNELHGYTRGSVKK